MQRAFLGAAIVLAALIVVAGCDSETTEPNPSTTTGASVGASTGGSSAGGASAGGAGGAATGGTTATGGDSGVYQVLLETTIGDVVIEVHRDWAPNGADHFKELVETGFYDGCSFFRVLPGFIAQWGLNDDPALNTQWASTSIDDDPVVESNVPGTITFAQTSQPNSRTTQLFINYGDNSFLDADNFAPFARVISGMDVLIAINDEYGEQPNQNLIRTQGATYLDANFPNLDRITKATIQ